MNHRRLFPHLNSRTHQLRDGYHSTGGEGQPPLLVLLHQALFNYLTNYFDFFCKLERLLQQSGELSPHLAATGTLLRCVQRAGGCH